MGKYADQSSLREKKVTLAHSLRCKKHIMVGKAAAVQLAFNSQEAECSECVHECVHERMRERMHARAFRFVQFRILSQGMTLSQ